MKTRFSFQLAQDQTRATRQRLDGLDRYAASGRAVIYQPTLTSTATQPTVDPAAITGCYVRHNDLLVAWVTIIPTAGFNAGTGDWLISMPGTLVVMQNVDGHHGTWLANIGGTETAGTVRSHSADRTKVKCSYLTAYPSGARVNVGAGNPGTWAVSSQLHLTVVSKVET